MRTAIEEFLIPQIIGRDPADITDIVNGLYVSSYWRGGPVLNNAISGVDQALWDIKGKVAGMPVWQLLGGRARRAVPVYAHASGRDLAELTDNVRALKEQGYRYIRVQMAIPGASTYGARQAESETMDVHYPVISRNAWDPLPYIKIVPEMFAHLRSEFGYEIELLHDVHSRLTPIQAVGLAKDLEPYKLFFLEDLLAPEDTEWLRMVRQQCATPIAIGELFTDYSEFVPLMRERLLDFVRMHISDIGGLTPAWRVASACELLGHPHRLARSARPLADRPQGQPGARPRRSGVRHPGAVHVERPGTGDVPRSARGQGHLQLGLVRARLGVRLRRGAGGQASGRLAVDARQLGAHPRRGRDRPEALTEQMPGIQPACTGCVAASVGRTMADEDLRRGGQVRSGGAACPEETSGSGETLVVRHADAHQQQVRRSTLQPAQCFPLVVIAVGVAHPDDEAAAGTRVHGRLQGLPGGRGSAQLHAFGTRIELADHREQAAGLGVHTASWPGELQDEDRLR